MCPPPTTIYINFYFSMRRTVVNYRCHEKVTFYRCKKFYWQALTGNGLLNLPFRLPGFGPVGTHKMMFLKWHLLRRKTHRVICQFFFSKLWLFKHVLEPCHQKEDRSNVTSPMRVRANFYHSQQKFVSTSGINNKICIFRLLEKLL
jgi:hypothetical protein